MNEAISIGVPKLLILFNLIVRINGARTSDKMAKHTLLNPSHGLAILHLPSHLCASKSRSLAKLDLFALFRLFQPNGLSLTPLYIDPSLRGSPNPWASFARAAATLPGRGFGVVELSSKHIGDRANDVERFMLIGDAMIWNAVLKSTLKNAASNEEIEFLS